jgi:F-type H+-transporting ATPase subunit epsilon
MIRLKLITLKGAVVDADVYEVILPTKAGDIAVNGGHAPLVSVLRYGIIYVKKQKSTRIDDRDTYAVYGGTAKVLNNELIVLADEVEDEESLSADHIQKALDKAKEHKANAKDQISVDKAQEMVDRQTVRLHLAGLRRRSR